MHERYIPLLKWFDIECEKLKCVPPTEEEQNDGKGDGWYWNPNSSIYWNPVAVRKLWT